MSHSITYRPYQVEGRDAAFAEFVGGTEATCVVLPTGCGKTVLSGMCFEEALRRGRRGLFLAHREVLITQAFNTLSAFGFDCAIEMAGLDARSNIAMTGLPQVTVGSVQSLQGDRLRRWEPDAFGLIVTDECHRALADGHRNVFDHFRGYWHLGITATPDRGDERNIGSLYRTKAYEYSMRRAVREGWLAPVRTRECRVQVDLRGVKLHGGDFSLGELVERVTPMMEQLCRAFAREVGDRPAVFFTPDVGTANLAAQIFARLNRPSEYVAGVGGEWGMSKAEKDEKLGRFNDGKFQIITCCDLLFEGWDCLDGQTEVLTPSGWAGRGELAAGDPVYSLNRETGLLEIVAVDEYGERPVRPGERMARIESQHLDIRVTEGHRFHIKYADPTAKGRPSRDWVTRTGLQMAERGSPYYLPLAAESARPHPGVPLTDDEIRLIARFMTDGGFVDTDLVISQAKHHHDEIRSLLDRLGLDYSERTRPPGPFGGRPVHEFRIPKGTHGGSLARRGWARYRDYLDKYVAGELDLMTREQFRLFWEELLKGDGERAGPNHSGWLWCEEERQADCYTRMAVVRGFAASYHRERTEAGSTAYRVSVRDTRWIISNPRDPRASRITLESPADGETVWCVRNRNSTLVTRRNGKIAIIGNCPKVAAVGIGRVTRKRYRYTQMVGRGTRPSPATGKEDCLVVDFDWQADAGAKDICASVDLFDDGSLDPEVRDEAARRERERKGQTLDPEELIAQAEQVVKIRRTLHIHLTGKSAEYEAITYDPVGVAKLLDINLNRKYDLDRRGTNPASPKQLGMLRSLGMDAPAGLSKWGASKMIDRLMKRRDLGLASPGQIKTLLTGGVNEEVARSLSVAQASDYIAALDGYSPAPAQRNLF